MEGAIGLLLYVAVMILGSVLKKMAEGKAKQAQTPMVAEDEVYTVTLNDMLGEESSLEVIDAEENLSSPTEISGLELTVSDRLEEFHSQGIEDFEDFEDFEDWDEDSESQESADDSRTTFDNVRVLLKPHWAQAIVLSEIIREPRAKRPWPNR